MKIKIEGKYGACEIVEYDKEKNIYDMINIVERILIAYGYSQNSVKEGFKAKSSEYTLYSDEETE